ncbi:unnamed protein product [Pieris macdunnoughi]|uniref:Odorant receptor n=2 Tax=Pieris macdunnoughi TaxID=345717 RepID=A0A821PPY6_9NEOP|nr:unnamed protein product [Pieris macdunnoughi]
MKNHKEPSINLSQENFDFSTGYVDPFEFHKTCFMFLKAFQVWDGAIPKWTYLLKALILFCGLSALTLLQLGFYHGLDTRDLPYMTESGTYVLIMIYKLLIMSCTVWNLPDYHNLLRIIREDFQYVCNKGKKYRERFFQNQLKIWKICQISMVFLVCIALGMMLFSIASLIWYLKTHGSEIGTRPLPFPIWVPHVDIGKSPLYEVCLIYSNICVVTYAINFIFMMQIQILWIGEIATKADLVIWSIEDLMNGIRPALNKQEELYFSTLLKQRMQEIVKIHKSMIELMTSYARVYTKLLMFEQKVCAPVVCLSAYGATEILEKTGEINGILVILCIATIISVFIPSCLCNFLSIKVSSICYACWNIPFWNATPVIRPYIVLIMQRSLRPLPIKASGFEEVSIETFSNKMASAYSFYNMLRHIKI